MHALYCVASVVDVIEDMMAMRWHAWMWVDDVMMVGGGRMMMRFQGL